LATSREQNIADRRKSKSVRGGNIAMEEVVKLVSTYGVSFVIVAIFLWDYIVNKKRLAENQEIIKDTLTAVKETDTTIANCLKEMQQQNLNTAKSLELLQRQMENTDKKVDKLLERGR
jgi:hypothetical protein